MMQKPVWLCSVPVLLLPIVLGGAGCAYHAGDPGAGRPAFDQVWYEDAVDWSVFTEIYVAPVRTDRLKLDFGNEVGESQRDQMVAKIARIFRHKVIEAFEEDPGQRLRVVETAGPETLVLELWLQQIHPSRTVHGSGMGGQRSRKGATVEFDAVVRRWPERTAIAAVHDRRTRGEDGTAARGGSVTQVLIVSRKWAGNLRQVLGAIMDGSYQPVTPVNG